METQPQTPHDVARIRKAYNRVLKALTEAKAAGQAELVEKYRTDYFTLKQMLANAKESETAGSATPTTPELLQEISLLKDRLAKAEEIFKAQRATIVDLQYKLELAEDEVRSLRAPLPAAEYQRAQTLPTTPAQALTTAELLEELLPQRA